MAVCLGDKGSLLKMKPQCLELNEGFVELFLADLFLSDYGTFVHMLQSKGLAVIKGFYLVLGKLCTRADLELPKPPTN